MTRRVIFPDPEIWTEPKEAHMTAYADQPGPADARRAAALTIWHRRGNPDGITEIVRESAAIGRLVELLLAVLDLHRTAIAELRSEAGINLMALFVQGIAEHAEQNNAQGAAADIRRSAQLLDAHGRDDTADINRAVQEASNAGRGVQLFTRLLDIYEHLLPELTSDHGIDWLNRCIAAFANEEVQDGDS